MKALFFDVDGTLIPFGQGVMSESVKETLMKLKSNGHLIFINSGRTYGQMSTYLLNFPFDGYVLGCGLSGMYKGEYIFKNTLPKDKQLKLKEAFMATGEPGAIVCEEATAFFNKNEFTDGITDIVTREGGNVVELEDIKEISKLELYPEDIEVYNRIKDEYGDMLACTVFEADGRFTGEFCPKGCDKGTGIKQMVSLLGIDEDDVYVFGDSGNDIPMLTAFKHSIVMGDSLDNIKQYAEYVTGSAYEDGIKEACEHYGLI